MTDHVSLVNFSQHLSCNAVWWRLNVIRSIKIYSWEFDIKSLLINCTKMLINEISDQCHRANFPTWIPQTLKKVIPRTKAMKFSETSKPSTYLKIETRSETKSFIKNPKSFLFQKNVFIFISTINGMTGIYLLVFDAKNSYVCKLREVQSTMCHIKLISVYLSISETMNDREKWARYVFEYLQEPNGLIWKQLKVSVSFYATTCRAAMWGSKASRSPRLINFYNDFKA